MMARYGTVLAKDQEETDKIASWVWSQYNLCPMKMDMAVGIVDTDTSNLIGSAFFHSYNGYNIELAYYGVDTPTLGIAKSLARIAIYRFNVIRVTIRTATYNDHIIKGMKKFGFIEEGIEKNFYGYGNDCVRLALHRAGIERIAGYKPQLH